MFHSLDSISTNFNDQTDLLMVSYFLQESVKFTLSNYQFAFKDQKPQFDVYFLNSDKSVSSQIHPVKLSKFDFQDLFNFFVVLNSNLMSN